VATARRRRTIVITDRLNRDELSHSTASIELLHVRFRRWQASTLVIDLESTVSMKNPDFDVSRLRAIATLAVFAGALSACGGGGDAGSVPVTAPSVSAATAGAAKYSQRVLLTLTGTNLDQGLTVAATGCSNVAPSVTPASTPTTAYYQCTASALGNGQFTVTRSSDGAMLASAAFVVPVPTVTMTLTNGTGGAVNGSLVVTLAPDKTPLTVDNFLAYVNAGFYDGTVFHRLSPGFVVQGGGYVAPVNRATPTAKPANAPIALEVDKGLSNTQWTIAMARTTNAASATSQFFINLADNSASLDPSPLNGAGYAVFGTVSSGTATVTSITTAPCATIPLFLPSGDCTPTPNVVVSSAVQTQ
jgi:cyclophilin family peptidyl-prolyl cis-trans isomerase